MADIHLDKGTTMLLMADFSLSGMGQNPIAQARQTLERAREVLDAARHAGIFIGYCISHFRPGFPEVSDRNKTRAARRDAGEVLPTDPAALIHPAVQPSTTVVVMNLRGACSANIWQCLDASGATETRPESVPLSAAW